MVWIYKVIKRYLNHKLILLDSLLQEIVKMAPVVKLTYFNLHGKGEHIRFILLAGKVAFEDNRIEFADWGALKPTTVLGQLPILNWDGLELVQSNAIARFIAKKVGLAGSTEEDFVHADMILEHCVDYLNAMIKMRFEKDAAAKQTLAETFLTKTLPNWLAGAEKMLKARGGKWYAGNQLTFGDLAVQHVLFWLTWADEKGFVDVTGCDARFTILDGYPLVKANYEMVGQIPEIKNYIETRPESKMGL